MANRKMKEVSKSPLYKWAEDLAWEWIEGGFDQADNAMSETKASAGLERERCGKKLLREVKKARRRYKSGTPP